MPRLVLIAWLEIPSEFKYLPFNRWLPCQLSNDTFLVAFYPSSTISCIIDMQCLLFQCVSFSE